VESSCSPKPCAPVCFTVATTISILPVSVFSIARLKCSSWFGFRTATRMFPGRMLVASMVQFLGSVQAKLFQFLSARRRPFAPVEVLRDLKHDEKRGGNGDTADGPDHLLYSHRIVRAMGLNKVVRPRPAVSSLPRRVFHHV